MSDSGTYYEVLGCRVGASDDELRRAYLKLARRHHPDFHTDATPAQHREAQIAMQRLNEAWYVLGDTSRRSDYDRSFNGRQGSSGPGGATGRPHDTWHPFDDGLVDFEIDDTPIDGSRGVPPLLTVLPVLLLLLAALLLGAALLFDLRALVAASAVAACLGVAAFIVVPLVALTRSQRDPRLD